jgi:imidazolonepropionase-like amidohydrolase
MGPRTVGPTALASATSKAADACALGDRTGRLRAGLHADLLLVSGDPTDITAIRDTRMVVSHGRITHFAQTAS